jgi:hypothetical protein
VAFAQTIPTAEEAPYEIADEDAFLSEMSKRFSDGKTVAHKLWKTSPPGMRRTMEALMRPQAGLARLSEIEYLVEAIDPKHRTVTRDLILRWAASTSEQDIATWLDSGLPAGGAYTTEYMTDERREEYRLEVAPPAILKRDGQPLQGDNIFVFSSDRVFYGGSKTKGSDLSVHHSSFMAGKAVHGAGHFYTTDAGVLETINDRSGHYAPTTEHFIQVLLELHGAGMNLAAIQFFFDEKQQTAEAWLDRELHPQAATEAEDSPFTAFEDSPFTAFEDSPFTAFEDVEEANVS